MMVAQVSISHEGYLEILITALGVLITVLAVALAGLGIFGYASFKQALTEAVEKAVGAGERAAERTAKEVAAETYARELDKKVNDITKKAVAAALRSRRKLEQGKALSREQFVEVKSQPDASKRTAKVPRRAKRDSDLKGASDGEREDIR